jgi:hypothetical protein
MHIRCAQVMVVMIMAMVVGMGMVVAALEKKSADDIDDQAEDSHPDGLVKVYFLGHNNALDGFNTHH